MNKNGVTATSNKIIIKNSSPEKENIICLQLMSLISQEIKEQDNAKFERLRQAHRQRRQNNNNN